MDLPVVLGIDHAGLVGEDGETHHGIFDIGLLHPLPNIILSQPSDSKEARNLLFTAFRQKHPFAIRYPKGYTKISNNEFEQIEIGTWTCENDLDTNKLYLLTYGDDYKKILEKVISNNLPVTVVNCRFFKPLDTIMLDKIALSNKPIITYEIDMLDGGLGSYILAYFNERNYKKTIKRFGIGDKYIQQGSNRQLLKEQNIDFNNLFEEIMKELEI